MPRPAFWRGLRSPELGGVCTGGELSNGRIYWRATEKSHTSKINSRSVSSYWTNQWLTEWTLSNYWMTIEDRSARSLLFCSSLRFIYRHRPLLLLDIQTFREAKRQPMTFMWQRKAEQLIVTESLNSLKDNFKYWLRSRVKNTSGE